MPFVSESGVHLVKQAAHVVWLRALLCNRDDPAWVCSCVYTHGCFCVLCMSVSWCVCVYLSVWACECVWTPSCLQSRTPSVSVWRWKGRAELASINQARLQRQRGLQLPSTTQPPLLYVNRHTAMGLYGLVDCIIAQHRLVALFSSPFVQEYSSFFFYYKNSSNWCTFLLDVIVTHLYHFYIWWRSISGNAISLTWRPSSLGFLLDFQ